MSLDYLGFIYFSNTLGFSVSKLVTSLAKIIPRCFILLDAIVNAIVLSIYFSDCSWSVYRNVTDFCVLNSLILPNTGILQRYCRFSPNNCNKASITIKSVVILFLVGLAFSL